MTGKERQVWANEVSELDEVRELDKSSAEEEQHYYSKRILWRPKYEHSMQGQ